MESNQSNILFQINRYLGKSYKLLTFTLPYLDAN